MTSGPDVTQQELVHNYYNECKALLSVNHKRLLKLKGVMIDTKEEGEYHLCLLTKYYKKGNLSKLIQNKSLFQNYSDKQKSLKKLELIRQIAEGVKAIHDANLIHRDIKPSNILIDDNEEPILADFGLTQENLNNFTIQARASLNYKAPELNNLNVFQQSDIWSLACVSVEIINENPINLLQENLQCGETYDQRFIQHPKFSDQIEQNFTLKNLLKESFNQKYQDRPTINSFLEQLNQAINDKNFAQETFKTLSQNNFTSFSFVQSDSQSKKIFNIDSEKSSINQQSQSDKTEKASFNQIKFRI